MFEKTHAYLKSVSRLAAIVGGLGIIFISVMVTVDVFIRKFAGLTLGGATEISGFIFAIATAFAYPYVLLDRANVRIDVLYTLATPKVRAFVDLLAMLAMLCFVALLSESVWQLLQRSWVNNSKSIGVVIIPLWIPQSLWVLGYLLLSLTALFLTVYAVVGLSRRNWGHVIRIIGIPSVEETIHEETHIDDLPVGREAVRKSKEPL